MTKERKKENEKASAKTLLKEIGPAFIIAVVLVLGAAAIIKPAVVKQSSMEPTLKENELLFLNKQAYLTSEPQRGDIIVFKTSRNDGKKLLIKRVIGTGGETVEIDGYTVKVDSKILEEPYIMDIEADGQPQSKQVFQVPYGSVFVMGDNRLHSVDSRSSDIGYISEKDIIGKVIGK